MEIDAKVYRNICDKRTFEQIIEGKRDIDILMLEFLLSRMHMQKNYMDIILSDYEFDLNEKRLLLENRINTNKTDEAARLLEEYRVICPKNKVHQQYILLKQIQIEQKKGIDIAPERFQEALELTMSLSVCRERVKSDFVISESEIVLYVGFLKAQGVLDRKKTKILMTRIQKFFLENHICLKIYFELGLHLSRLCLEAGKYEEGIALCDDLMDKLSDASREYYACEILFQWAKLLQKSGNTSLSKWKFQEAYYVAVGYMERELAEEIRKYIQEETKWHITD